MYIIHIFMDIHKCVCVYIYIKPLLTALDTRAKGKGYVLTLYGWGHNPRAQQDGRKNGSEVRQCIHFSGLPKQSTTNWEGAVKSRSLWRCCFQGQPTMWRPLGPKSSSFRWPGLLFSLNFSVRSCRESSGIHWGLKAASEKFTYLQVSGNINPQVLSCSIRFLLPFTIFSRFLLST